MTPSPRVEPLRLLVVEDEAMIAMMLEDRLAELGHVVLDLVSAVPAALRRIDELAAEIDAAVLDANLGGEFATPVAEKLRALGIPFVLATGYEATNLARIGLVETTVRKPCRKDDLARALADLPLRAF